jgi:hypothetical protein
MSLRPEEETTPRKAFGSFRKGAEYSQHRWTF